MPQNPPRFFAPRYFAPGYWGGEQVEGSVSASLMGSSAMTAVLTGVQSGFSGGSFYFKNRRFRVVVPQPKPAYIHANIEGAGRLSGKARATAAIRASLGSGSSFKAVPAALAHGFAAIGGQGNLSAGGVTIDRYARAREEDELWLIAA
jgi:hypothetical protein